MVVDLVVDSAVNLGATFVIHVDDSTVTIFVSTATTASKSSIPTGSLRDIALIDVESLETEHHIRIGTAEPRLRPAHRQRRQ